MSLQAHGCRAAAALISKRCDAPLSVAEQLRLRLHLLVCGRCRRFAGQTRLMQKASAGWRAYSQADNEKR